MRFETILICVGYTALCLVWNFWAGPSVGWDQIHYHLYNALAWHEGRLPSELFAASTQTYLNPLAHLPYYGSISFFKEPIYATSLVAVLHSSNLWLLHAIASLMIRERRPVLRRLMVIYSVLFGALSPVFLVEIGGSFSDVIVCIPILAAILFALWFLRVEESSPHVFISKRNIFIVASGVFAGVAAGLKPTSFVDVAGLFIGLLLSLSARHTLISILYLFGSLCGYMLSGGRHALMLLDAFNNPVFPMFNAYFKSPWFEEINLVSDRFRPQTFLDASRYPIDLADAFSRVGIELLAVDYRLLALIFCLGLLAASKMIGRTKGMSLTHVHLLRPIFGRVQRFYWITLVCTYAFWLYTSGNVRYAMPLFLMLGVGFMQVAVCLRGKIKTLVLIVPIVGQIMAVFMLNAKRWDYYPSWDKSQYEWTIPDKLRSSAAYYISMQSQSYSAIALALPRESRLVNALGHMPLSPSGLMWRKCVELRQKLDLPWRSLMRVAYMVGGSGVPTTLLDFQDAMLSEYNLKADRSDCDFIGLGKSNVSQLKWMAFDNKKDAFSAPPGLILFSCRLVEGALLGFDDLAHRKRLDALFEVWESRCPDLFSPSPAVSVQTGMGRRMRMYAKSETKLMAIDGRLYAQSIWAFTPTFLQLENASDVAYTCPDLLNLNRSRKMFR